jgi:S-adenosylmethionine synthetase
MTGKPDYIASISYGKDSLAMLEVIKRNGLPLDRIITVDIMATADIPADLPPMLEFKVKADAIIKEKYGITVEHITAPKSYEEYFYYTCNGKKSRNVGKIYGFPLQKGNWCNSRLKVDVLDQAQRGAITYIGIAADEPARFHNISETKRAPLVEYGWTEAMCRKWCAENDLLSPLYTTSLRGGCWFCHNQRINQLRRLRKNYPELWALLLKWDKDSPVTFKANGQTIHDFDRRFHMEEQAKVPIDKTFRWEMILEDNIMTKRIYTAESVTSGHPDKLADLIADSILDECLEQDPDSRVAVEVMLAHNKCFVSGEITTNAKVDYEYVAKTVIAQVGYNPNNLEFEVRIHEQSPDIAGAVNRAEQGAGDQGIVYGYATDETLNYMPLPAELAHRLTYRLEECRRNGIIKGLLPDGKSQVTVQFNGDRFDKILSVLVSAQHEEWKELGELKSEIRAKVIGYVFAEYDMSDVEILVNPSGRFVLGGYEADTGLTGRKLMVDTYGGIAHHGGGAMSGKDASKVDRSGAYLARYLAKNIVAAGLAEKCEVALSYAIGLPTPISIDINTFFTGAVNERLIERAVSKVFDLRVGTVIDYLGLKKPVYSGTAVGGHFGKEEFAWEKTDKAQELKNAVMS